MDILDNLKVLDNTKKTTINKTASDYWNECLVRLKGILDETQIKTWFGPIKAKSWNPTDKILTIETPSIFYQEWIEGNYYDLVKKIIESVLGEKATLVYETVLVNDTPSIQPVTVSNKALNYPPSISSLQIQQKPTIKWNSNLNPRFAFDSFVAGDSNNLALSTAKAVSLSQEGINNRFSPFFIYGNPGVGKTHLAQAIGNSILQQYPNKRVLYVTSDQFTSEFVSSINQKDNGNSFMQLYSNLDVLIIDDIQTLANKEATQLKFFQIYNTLQQFGKKIILTADQPPRDIKDITERLVTRFQSNLAIEIKNPDLKLRTDVIKYKSKTEGIELSDDVVEVIARNTKMIREIEGILIKLVVLKTFDNKIITPELAYNVIKDLASEQKAITVNEIKEKIAVHYNIRIEDMISKSRKHEIALARQMAIFMSRKLTNLSLKEIGAEFGGRDHSTVLHSCSAIQDYLDTDQKMRIDFETIEDMFANR